MRLKSYFAASVAEAIENARVELGPEAMLLNSREIAPQQRHLGAFEVVFGITGEPLLPRRSDTTTQLFTPPAVQASASRQAVLLQTPPAPAPPAPATEPVAAVPAWKRTLEELVSRQSNPVTLGSLLQAQPEAPKTEPVSKKQEAEPVRPEPGRRAIPFTPVTPQAQATEKPRAAAASSPAVESPKSQGELGEELLNLRTQIERVQNSLSISGAKLSMQRSREVELLEAQAVDFGFSPAFARMMVEATIAGITAAAPAASPRIPGNPNFSLEDLQRSLIAELHGRLQVQPVIGTTGADSGVMMLVGPPGAGKTTTLVKLAIKYGLQRRVPVHLLSLDTVRVGGSEQLATFSRILNVAFDALHTTAALHEALSDCHTDELVLIDCPGYAPADMEEASATAAFLRRNPDVDVQLVLPAVMNTSSLQTAMQRFSIFKPSKLLFTHLDEVDSLGAVIEHTVKSQLPVSFLTDGQGIPQDLQEASKDRLTRGILNGAAAFGAA